MKLATWSQKKTMRPYHNRSGNSGVLAYDIGADSITIEFGTGTYLYNYSKPGRAHVEQMQRLAQNGQGLATYISQHVRDNFAARVG